MRKNSLFTFIVCMFFLSAKAQTGDSLVKYDVWRGSYYPNGTTPKDGKMIYLQLPINKTETNCKIYNQLYNTQDYAIKKVKINYESLNTNKLKLDEIVIMNQSSGRKTKWCRLQMELSYDSLTGYLQGSYSSKECKNTIGKIVMYKYSGEFPEIDTKNKNINSESLLWWLRLDQDIIKGLKAPEIRQKERDNFVFQPIFFDFDKADIKSEFHNFLNELIHIVEQHSDLRIRVIGHTDWDGTDAYNDKLSERRAQAIINYFIDKGLEADRLEFDFKGEKEPIDTNETSQGRQRNRRVDFEFI